MKLKLSVWPVSTRWWNKFLSSPGCFVWYNICNILWMPGILKHIMAVVETPHIRSDEHIMSDQTMSAHYLSQVHQVSNFIFIIFPVFTVVLQDEVLSQTDMHNMSAQHVVFPVVVERSGAWQRDFFLNYRVDSLTTSPLRYIFLNCAEKPTVACQVGWWEPSFSQCQPEAGDAKSLRLRCDYSQ